MNVKMSRHCAEKVAAGVFNSRDLHEAYNNPDTVYPSLKYPTQEKRIGNGLCLCVDKRTGVVVTVFVHKVETALRSDQTDRDAVAWANRQPKH